MITNIRIDGFRGLDGVQLDDLGQFNLLVGPGCAGKTNIIEALFLFLSNGDPGLLLEILKLRRIYSQQMLPSETVECLDWLFTVGAHSREFHIKGAWDGIPRSVSVSKREQGDEIPLRSSDDATINQESQAALAVYDLHTKASDSEFSGQIEVLRDRLKVARSDSSSIPGRFISPGELGQSRPLAAIWSKAEEEGYDERIVEMVRAIDGDVTGLRIIADDLGRAAVRIDHKRLGRIPLEFMGGGFGKAIAIACNTVAARNGLLLVDEFDAALHPGAQPIVIEFLMRAAQDNNVQLCLSTHSIETVDAFLDAFDELSGLFHGPEGLRVFQVHRAKGKTRVKSLDADTAKRLREDIGHDLRLRA